MAEDGPNAEGAHFPGEVTVQPRGTNLSSTRPQQEYLGWVRRWHQSPDQSWGLVCSDLGDVVLLADGINTFQEGDILSFTVLPDREDCVLKAADARKIEREELERHRDSLEQDGGNIPNTQVTDLLRQAREVQSQQAAASTASQQQQQQQQQQAAQQGQQKNTPIMVTPYRHNWLISGSHRGNQDGAWYEAIKGDLVKTFGTLSRYVGGCRACAPVPWSEE
mmetsp:Transcript_61095/g.133776  ORF Transcript_61095/g.133776 Transcript_61095/m.133776 type:complete len:221 (-) Transcript_61095:179-841(-)